MGALGITNKRILTEAEELVLCNMIIDTQRCGLFVIKRNIINFVEDIIKNERDDPKQELNERLDRLGMRKTGQACDKWFRGFMKRNPEIVFRRPELLSKSRMNVTPQQIVQ